MEGVSTVRRGPGGATPAPYRWAIALRTGKRWFGALFQVYGLEKRPCRRSARLRATFRRYEPETRPKSPGTSRVGGASGVDVHRGPQGELGDQLLEVGRGGVQAAVGDRAAHRVVGAAVDRDLIPAGPSRREVRLVGGERQGAASVHGVQAAADLVG